MPLPRRPLTGTVVREMAGSPRVGSPRASLSPFFPARESVLLALSGEQKETPQVQPSPGWHLHAQEKCPWPCWRGGGWEGDESLIYLPGTNGT